MNNNNYMKRIITLLAVLTFAIRILAENGFAIIIDSESYRQAKAEVDQYASAIEKYNGLHTSIIEEKTGHPDSIRATLIRMHQSKVNPIVGAVFIGDIPVVMVRDGQHLTSAFKMNQSSPREESSVPSDRFYDDFGLKFDFIDKDTTLNYCYYSLRADSRQTLRPDIYTGRIRPSDCGGTSRYEKLRSFLTKAVAEKSRQRQLGQLFFFSGHGYISESKTARLDEKQAYFEHFPSLHTNRNNISYMDHSDNYTIKQRFMNELMRSDLDFALVHHHGYFDTEYFNGLAPINTVAKAKEFMIRNIRQHIYSAHQRGKNSDSISLALQKKFDVPASWVTDALNDSIALADSTYDAATDLHLEDFKVYGYQPNCPLVIIDACYCGSFHLEDCIADEYIFQPGTTVAVIANTVNSLQDKWSDHLIGLVQQGGVAGDVVRYSGYLESHLIGDPTFRYTSDSQLDIDNLILKDKPSDWKKLLKSPLVDVQSLAIHHLARQHNLSSADLLRIYESSPYGLIRMQALADITAFYNDDNTIKCIELASLDAFELVQRQSLRYIMASGDERLIPALIRVSIANNTSDRVNFDAMGALATYPKDKLVEEFARQFDTPNVKYVYQDSIRSLILTTIERYADRHPETLEELLSDSLTTKQRTNAIRSMRNSIAHHTIPTLINYFQTKADNDTRVLIMEMLGWHTNSVYAKEIANAALAASNNEEYPADVRNEALKTYNRVKK